MWYGIRMTYGAEIAIKTGDPCEGSGLGYGRRTMIRRGG
jgi:hypothetical protein